jgi:small subunit ribosomal protein S21
MVVNWKGTRRAELYMTEIIMKKGEHVEKALRRLKKKLSREGTFEQVRRRRYFEKPSVKARRKLKAARFTAMLRERYADQ